MHPMNRHYGIILLALVSLAPSCGRRNPSPFLPAILRTNVQEFAVRGVIREVKTDDITVVIHHEAIAGYMEPMTMPFRAKDKNVLAGLQAGDTVSFRLSVADDESWIDQITRLGHATDGSSASISSISPTNSRIPTSIDIVDGLATFAFTNEFGRAVKFGDFKGQAIGLTFFFTRCPLPEFCPRLTKNFAAATRKLQALPNAPTNWHFFSISFDTQVDSPAVLRSYAKSYGYDSNRWSFVTSSQTVIDEVARRFNFSFKNESGTFTHHFFTIVLDANGYWHAGWPVGGDTSDNLVEEIVKAAAVRPAR